MTTRHGVRAVALGDSDQATPTIMKLRTLFASVVATSLLACVGEVTSLGGVEQPAAMIVDDDPNAESTESSDSTDAGRSASPGTDAQRSTEEPMCMWYSWMPVASEVENQYLLPANAPTNSNPGFKPANWDLTRVRVELVRGPAMGRRIGDFRRGPEDCGREDGWYFSDGESGATATRYSLCPALREAITAPEDFRLSAGVCE